METYLPKAALFYKTAAFTLAKLIIFSELCNLFLIFAGD